MEAQQPSPTDAKRPVGRPKGSTNARTRELAKKLAAEEMTPLEVMVRVMKQFHADAESIDPEAIAAEIDDSTEQGKKDKKEALKDAKRDKKNAYRDAVGIAQSAAPYIHAKLQTVTLQGDEDGGPILVENKRLTADEYKAALIARGLTVPNLKE